MSTSEVDAKLVRLSNMVTGALVFIAVAAITMTVVMTWLAFQQGGQAERLEAVAKTTHGALCAFKSDLSVRRENLILFIEQNPAGIPGISRATLDQSLGNYNQTLLALGVLRDC